MLTKHNRHSEVAADGNGWVRYQSAPADVQDDEQWFGALGLRLFKLLLWIAIAALASLTVRNVLLKGVAWADAGTVAALCLVLWLVSKKPEWNRPLSWVVFTVLFLDVLDGITYWVQAITPTHLLLPILVLYGALLCDIAITVAATLAVLGICAVTWLRFAPLSIVEAMMLSNIVLATLISGLTALGVWMHQKRLMRELRLQAERLHLELQTNKRLNAIIFHDIANPLTALAGLLELARLPGRTGTCDMNVMHRNVGRITSVIRMASVVNLNRLDSTPRESVTTDRMLEDLREVFSARLGSKRQTISLTTGTGLRVQTVYDVLLNSVLANLVSNAIKFSPPGSVIEIRAENQGDLLRVTVCDQGGGFPPEFLLKGGRRMLTSTAGTQGETGSGLGLDIVAFYVSRLGGALELMNLPEGGGAASVVLPLSGQVDVAAG